MRLDGATQLAGLIGQDKQDRTASFQGGDTWAAKLTLGQIIKGKVLRSYGEGRYAVDFGGEHRVVDSGVPLSAGDQLRGRVVGLSERVTIERLPDRDGAASPREEAPQRTNILPQGADAILQAAQQLHIRVDANDAAAIAGVAKKVSNPELAIRAGLFLAKLGLPLSPELVRALFERVSASAYPAGLSASRLAPILDARKDSDSAPDPDAAGKVINALAQFLARDCKPDGGQSADLEQAESRSENPQSGAVPGFAAGPDADDAGTGDSCDGDSDRQHAALLAGILNVQTGARLQHRFRTLPVVIGGRLVEFDLALFDHAPRDKDGVQAKRLRFSLSTERGPVDVDATAIDNHVQIAFASPQARLLDALEEHAGHLGEGLQRHGWTLGGTTYRPTAAGSPAGSIVDHVLAQDSLRIAL